MRIARKHTAASFSARSRAAQQDEVLHGHGGGKIEWRACAPQFFFNMLLGQHAGGFFADPIYGGNATRPAGKLVGFPGCRGRLHGAMSISTACLTTAVPVSIQDIVDNVAEGRARAPEAFLLTRRIDHATKLKPGDVAIVGVA